MVLGVVWQGILSFARISSLGLALGFGFEAMAEELIALVWLART